MLCSIDEKHLKFRKARVGPWSNGSLHTMVKIPGLIPSTGGKNKVLNRIAFGAGVVTK